MYTISARNLMLEPLRAAITHASVHSGPPGKANQLGKRVAVRFERPAQAQMRLAEGLAFPVDEGDEVTHVAFWNGATGGVLLAAGALAKPASFPKRGVYVVDAGRLTLNEE